MYELSKKYIMRKYLILCSYILKEERALCSYAWEYKDDRLFLKYFVYILTHHHCFFSYINYIMEKEMKKLTPTCYLDEDKMLSVVQPENRSDWVVINDKAALMFGPDNKANCFKFVEEQ